MKHAVTTGIVLMVFLSSCNKSKSLVVPEQLYPLAADNKWIYVDSFFNESGFFYGMDTFTLKTTPAIKFNDELFTPITDQYDDSIFTVHCTDSAVYLLKRPSALLIYHKKLNMPVVITQYNNGLYTVTVQTTKITSTSHPSYKIVIEKNDGLQLNYRMQELYFAPGVGIINGRDFRYSRNGQLYAFGSYRLYQYSLY